MLKAVKYLGKCYDFSFSLHYFCSMVYPSDSTGFTGRTALFSRVVGINEAACGPGSNWAVLLLPPQPRAACFSTTSVVRRTVQ